MPPARRGKKKSQSPAFLRWLGVGALVAAGVAGGYAWRSYAPLPFPEGTPLAGDVAPASVPVKKEPRELKKLQAKLDELEEMHEKTEEDLAEIQIKSLLQDE
ncbi:MAG: hypothetical protein PWP23_2558 [Candidatus Sumerlaeota bacterium]|nr:hypothetical protein [Candidatus Sumerlaeota bacterium]